MASAYCPTCGTEVDDDARFCPACGTTLRAEEGVDLPEAPPWPVPAGDDAEQLTLEGGAAHPAAEEPDLEPPTAMEPDGAPEEPSGEGSASTSEPFEAEDVEIVGEAPHSEMEPEPIHEPALPASAPPPVVPPGVPPPPRRDADLPLTWPSTLSGWLIGGGAVLGAIALIASISDAVSLLLMLALLGVAATVFLADRLPEIPRLRLINLSVAMVGLGVALERAGFGARGADSVLLVAMIAAVGGALLIELDRDRSVNPPG